MERQISFPMERQAYYPIIRRMPNNESPTIFPNDFFKLKVCVYYHQIHPYNAVRPRLMYQFPSECIPCQIFFQEGHTFVRRMLSRVHLSIESCEEPIGNILSSIRENFQVVDSPPPSPSESKCIRIGLVIILLHNDPLRSGMEGSMQNFRMVPASNEAIQTSLKRSMVITPEECCVCLEDLNINAECYAMPCNHVFHLQCIKTWLQTSHVCPLCRYALPTL